MKKIILSFLLAGSLLSAGSLVQVGAGYSKGNKDADIGTAFIETSLITTVGLRLEYSKNISEHPEFSKEDITRYGLFATYTLPLTPSFSVTPKAGLIKSDGDFTLKDGLEKITDSSTNFTYGLEVNYHYNDFVALFVGYTDYGNKFDDIGDIKSSELDSQNYTFGVKLDF